MLGDSCSNDRGQTLFRCADFGLAHFFIEDYIMFKKKLPTKRVVIAGCRDYDDYDEAKQYIDLCIADIRKENNIIVVSGCASGADALGER